MMYRRPRCFCFILKTRLCDAHYLVHEGAKAAADCPPGLVSDHMAHGLDM